jgi:polygalacturonase
VREDLATPFNPHPANRRFPMPSIDVYPRLLATCVLALAVAGGVRAQAQAPSPNPGRLYDVRAFGATGDGKTLDTDAINRTIEAAAADGGGTVEFPPGTYLSFTIRLKSHVWLHLNPGSTIEAAHEAPGYGHYDEAEPNRSGGSGIGGSFHNALISGDSLVDIAITGPGVIYGKGLPRQNGGDAHEFAGPVVSLAPHLPASIGETLPGRGGNKSIGLVNCRNVLLRDIWIRQGGWSAMDALGVDNFTIENVKVDTNRDGFDIDCCRNVRIADCSVNALNDDGICLKSPDSLGTPLRGCENITITGCQVSGYDTGTFFDGTYGQTQPLAPDRDGPTGRIKFGTGSAGGFKNITISNCVFDRCRGLALEAVDGGTIENITITNIAMRNVSNAAIFLRVGDRGNGSAGRPVGTIHGVSISHIVATDVDGRFPIIIAGIPGHPVEDVRISDVRIVSRGGLSLADAAKQPAGLINPFFDRGPGARDPRDPYNPPEQVKSYPEPSMFGVLPASGIYVRHAKDLAFRDLKFSFEKDDTRPVIVLDDVAGAEFRNLKAPHAPTAPLFVLRQVTDFSVGDSSSVPDRQLAHAEQESL